MLRLSGTKQNFTTAYHPQSDGQTDVRNLGLEQYLRTFLADRPAKWSNFLPWAELALNCFHHEGLGTSPFHALYGREPPHLIAAPPSASTPPDVAAVIRQRGELIVALRKNLEKAQQRMRLSANRHRRHVEFQVGDRVLLKLQQYRQHSVAKPASTKLARRFYGPFSVLERIGSVAYRLQLAEGSRIHNVFHVSLLRPFVEGSQYTTTEFPIEFAWGKPIARPTKVIESRMVWIERALVEEVQVQWSDDGGEGPTWEPRSVIEKHFPELFLGDKEFSKEGGVDTGTPATVADKQHTPAEATEIGVREPEEEEPGVFETVDKGTSKPVASAAKERPLRTGKRPVKYGDFVSH